MALISMPARMPRLRRLRPEDRVEREPLSQNHGLTGLVIGTAIVAGSVFGLLAYDSGRPFAQGAVVTTTAPLVITVEPVSSDDTQTR